MPGRTTTFGTHMSVPEFYRLVSSSDDNSPAGVEAIQPAVELSLNVNYAKFNRIDVQAVASAAVTKYTIEIWGDMSFNATRPSFIPSGDWAGAAPERWALLETRIDLTRSTIITLNDVVAGRIKVLVTGLTGTGSVTLITSKTD